MRKNAGFLFHLLKFIVADLLAFFAIYFVHALLIKEFSVSDSLMKATYEILWRLISLQLIIQIFLMFVVAIWGYQKYFVLQLLAAVVAFSVAAVISFSDSGAILKLLNPLVRSDIGEGFAIVISVSFAWAALKRFSGKQI